SRQLAIVHTAMYDAVNAIDHTHTPYFVDTAAAPGTSREAAAAAAAYRASVSLFPTQTARFDAALARSLEGIPVGLPLIDGIVLGNSGANALLAERRDGGCGPVRAQPAGHHRGVLPPAPPPLRPAAAPAGGRRHAVRHPRRRPVPPRGPAGADRPGVHRRLQRGQGAGPYRQHDP